MIDEPPTDEDLQLPPRAGDTNDPILAIFARRQTIRDIDAAPLSMQELSNLLWAAFGVNRQAGPFGTSFGRTAGSASNSQEIDLYVALADGAYRYDGPNHRLALVTHSDVRASAILPAQRQLMDIPIAPVQLIYVADLDRFTHTAGFDEPGLHDPETQKAYYYVDTGLIAGNAYLFAAAHGLAAWFHNCDKPSLTESLKLKAEQRVLFAQSIGRPATD